MGEELHGVLSSVGDFIATVPEAGLWILAGFFIYKVLMYATTAGAIVYVLKLAITKLHDYKIKPKEEIYKIERLCIFTREAERLIRFLEHDVNQSAGSYIYKSDIDFLIDAFKEKKERK